eukprot:CAMPEP_0194081894 /NCGR_PEP_ID=MMETSP0149-20130528/7555_1 /TAXON_ID=122233 /ORGANISM="Chaetoceros debilis, Strain MM31A-1" /LENGTH=602 /DNA_ID=CAMNT_0038763911 /DNA_START=199 /DNA_END=2007 /DNA_ORIENTATION=-
MKLILAAYAITAQANDVVSSASVVLPHSHQQSNASVLRPSMLVRGGASNQDSEVDVNNGPSKNDTKKRKKKRRSKSGNGGVGKNSTFAVGSDEEALGKTKANDAPKIKIEQESEREIHDKKVKMPQNLKTEPLKEDAGTKIKTSQPNETTMKKPPRVNTRNVGNNAATTGSNGKKVDPKEEIVQTILNAKDDLYRILNLDKSQKATFTPIEITKAYRKRAVQTHPDKLNGDRRAFDKVSEANNILSDEAKRKLYDRYGIEVARDPELAARAAMSSGDHIFKSFFGGNGGPGGLSSRMSNQFRKNSDMKYELEVSLEDMYKGASREIQISLGKESKDVEVDIPSGIIPGSSIRLHGMVDHVSSATPGDVIFIIRQRKHEMFTRKGYDLAMEVKISLSEAVCGFQRKFFHLDGRQIKIAGPKIKGQSSDGSESPIFIKSGDVHVLKGEGMPKEDSTRSSWIDETNENERMERFGDLYIQYVVDMPSSKNADNLTGEERKMLGILLDKMQGLEGRIDDSSLESDSRRLRRALASDFGRASGTPEVGRNEDEHMPNEDLNQNFSRNGFQYFSSRGGRGQQFFSRGSSPFTSFSGAADDSDVQCQQM